MVVVQSDLIIVTKNDGDMVPAARRVAYEYMSALKYMRPISKLWRPKVKLCSAVTKEGLEDVWKIMEKFRDVLGEAGEMENRRAEQHQRWMWSYVEEKLLRLMREVKGREVEELELMVRKDLMSPGSASDQLVQMFLDQCSRRRD